MSATITWSTFRDSAGFAASTVTAALAALYDCIAAQAADATFPWEVCSYDLTHATVRYVCVKRKNGSAGRILYVATNATWTYNTQLSNTNGTTLASARLGSAYFPEVTSDIPANLTSSGDIFTGATNKYAGIGGAHAASSSSGSTWRISASSAGIVLVCITSGATFAVLGIAGDLLEKNDGTEILPVSGWTNTYKSLDPSIDLPATASATYGFYSASFTNKYSFGAGALIATLDRALNRDDSVKKAWFYPFLLYSAQLPRANRHDYQFRQIAYPAVEPLTTPEYLYGPSAVVQAQNCHTSAPWLVNFKFTA